MPEPEPDLEPGADEQRPEPAVTGRRRVPGVPGRGPQRGGGGGGWLGVPRWGWWMLGGLTLLLAGLAASWFALPIRQVAVTGNKVLSAAEVKALSGARPGSGWLYYGPRQARGLLSNPWIASASVTRHFPDSVEIAITERQPVLRLVSQSEPGSNPVPTSTGRPALVADGGLILPWKPGFEKLPEVSGWGPERLAESVLVTRALSRYTVQSVAYSPSGLSVKTAGGTAWSGDPKSLMKYAGSISMYPNKKINIYPWGVSVQQ